jgi:hypothetical protein
MKFRSHQHQLSRGLSEAQTKGWAWAGENEMNCPAYFALLIPPVWYNTNRNIAGMTIFLQENAAFKKGFSHVS